MKTIAELKAIAAAAASDSPHDEWLVGHGGMTGHPFVETTQITRDGVVYGAECWSPDLEDDELTNARSEANATHMAAFDPRTCLELLARLEAVTKARDEACDFADILSETYNRPLRAIDRDVIAQWRKAGQ